MTAALSTALVLGAGALALWAYVRFPRLAPEDWRVAAAHVGVGFVALNLAPPIVEAAVALPGTLAQATSIVAAVLLPLGYVSLGVLWLFLTVRVLEARKWS